MINLIELMDSLRNTSILSFVDDFETIDKIHYYGKCPFCDEVMIINDKDNRFYCFNCNMGGDIITYIMHTHKWSILETIDYLIKYNKLNVTLDDVKNSLEEDTSNLLLDRINRDAAIFYYRELRSKNGFSGMNYYTKERKLTKPTLDKFGLGFAPGKDRLYQYLKNYYTKEQLLEAGLIVERDNGSICDKFRFRVMVPIMDENSKVIAFGGRALGDWKPKYTNSSESLVFDKGRTLFALQYAKESKRKGFILCEGYMDVISMHQAGFDNAIASLGTALTEKHAELIKSYRDIVYLSYDNDAAGKKATEKNISILRKVGIEPKVLDLSPYKDPDEFIKNLGAKKFENRIKNAISADEFMVSYYMSQLETVDDPDSVMTKLALTLSNIKKES